MLCDVTVKVPMVIGGWTQKRIRRRYNGETEGIISSRVEGEETWFVAEDVDRVDEDSVFDWMARAIEELTSYRFPPVCPQCGGETRWLPPKNPADGDAAYCLDCEAALKGEALA